MKHLRWALAHEHAHAAFLRYFGGLGIARVWRNPSGDSGGNWFGGATTEILPMTAGGETAYVLLGLAGFLAQFKEQAPETQRDDAQLAMESFRGACDSGD